MEQLTPWRFQDVEEEGGSQRSKLRYRQNCERCEQNSPPLRCLERLARSIGALGASCPSDDLPLDGDGLAPTGGGESDPLAARYPLSRGAGAKQTTALEPLVAQ